MDQLSFRKAIGALKDSTTVGLAKVNSDYKELDVAIVKATNHVEVLAKEKYIHTIFDYISASKPRADVAYCINALARRLTKTRNWAVAIKTLIIIHRALREVDATFREELVNFGRTRSYLLNLSHFKDDSSPNAWDYSLWVRTYALYIEERLECFRVLKYDVEIEPAKTSELDSVDLLEHLPSLQQLLFRLLTCQPEGAAVYNSMIRYALSIVANESTKIYYAINGCTLNLVDKFFEMNRHDALRALEIYRKAGHQAERLSAFYEICQGLNHGREKIFVKIEQPPASFVAAMEEYVKEAPHFQPACQRAVNADRRLPAPKPVMAIEHKNENSDDKKSKPLPSEPSEASIPEASVPIQTQITDLLGLDNFSESTAKLEEHNAQALAIVSNYDSLNNTSTMDLTSGASGWELALVSAPSSNEGAVAESKLAGGLDKLTLDSLYDDAISRRTNPNSHLGPVASNPFQASQYFEDPFHASNNIAPPTNVQMATMAHRQSFAISPSGNPFGPANASYPSHNPYAGFM